MAKVLEHVEAHYEVQDVEMGKVYTWHPESVVIECRCGEKLTLTFSKDACGKCGAVHRATVQEALGDRPEEEKEVDHPWRSPHPYYSPTRGT